MSVPADPPAKPGDRIELIEMGVDPRSGNPDPSPIPAGTTGTVTGCVQGLQPGTFQISVNWDIERSLQLIAPVDRFRKIGEETSS